MPWYKTGTVSVTLNSNAVTGTGTAFIVNCRVGDAFRGPDGRWYEVTNVASNTAISIDPPYIGATASGGSYALAPMQGYVKDSADALRAIVNTYGAQLAALKTTGNYDILPISKGGTGGTTAAEARSGLGLGTASTSTLTTSAADTTAGRVLKVGDHGIGTGDAPTGNTPAGKVLNTLIGNSMFATTDASPSDFPASLGFGTFPMGIHLSRSPNLAAQFVMTASTNPTSGCYFRAKADGTWQNFRRVYTANDVVGTVSQAGGVPTGAIVESGSNANGYYVKFADGTMICARTDAYPTLDVNITSGTMFRSAAISPVAWAVSFISTPRVMVSSSSSSGVGWISKGGSATASSTPLVYEIELVSATRSVSIEYFGFGRWVA
ncbi:phage tail protein [Pseudomonas sp. JL2]|uniref:phage tail protein n=1 Tax=Pseudomonas sp. JL2 TaxID=2919942 RepID=UPI0028609CAD|nr:phage tail protein [Pseudomonas sp. JL2]MDR8383961.1 phage tail protein [Pseudomonas sp. JL2]